VVTPHRRRTPPAAGYTKRDGSLKGDLEGFLRDEFFASHCKLFGNRPFIWQVWDGTKDGFSVLLNYHKLDQAQPRTADLHLPRRLDHPAAGRSRG